MMAYRTKQRDLIERRHFAQKESGLTLIEIMISMVISLFLVGGVIEIFIASKHTYRMNEQLARLQEDGRLAIEMLTNDIRMIGYQGCADSGVVVPGMRANVVPTANFSLTGVQGVEVAANLAWDPALNPLITAPNGANIVNYVSGGVTVPILDLDVKVLPNTDFIVMQFADPSDATQVTAHGVLSTNAVTIDNNNAGFAQNDVVVVSNCTAVDIFQISAAPAPAAGDDVSLAHDATANSAATLGANYYALAAPPGLATQSVTSLASNLYFVGQSGIDEGNENTNRHGDPINSLYKMDIKGQVTEMIQGVDAMQILYGQRLATGNTRYVPANDATLNMTQVQSIKIGLLMHTIEPVTFKADTRTYAVNGTNYAPAGGAAPTYLLDNRIRRVFSSTINLRNRR